MDHSAGAGATSPRERLVATTLTMVQERGVHGTALAELLARSHTARGSVYQHFPAGKADLVKAAAEAASDTVVRWTDELAALDPHAQIDAMVDHWVKVMRRFDYTRGCPLAAIATDSAAEPALTVVGQAFDTWSSHLEAALDVDEDLATLIVCALEGAIMQSRSRRSIAPLDSVRRQLHRLMGRSGA